jgi:hypothetical protein
VISWFQSFLSNSTCTATQREDLAKAKQASTAEAGMSAAAALLGGGGASSKLASKMFGKK